MASKREFTPDKLPLALIIPVGVGLFALGLLDVLGHTVGRGRPRDIMPGFLVALAVLGCSWAWERFRISRKT